MRAVLSLEQVQSIELRYDLTIRKHADLQEGRLHGPVCAGPVLAGMAPGEK